MGGNIASGAENVNRMYFVLAKDDYHCLPAIPNMDDPSNGGRVNNYMLFQNYPNPFNSGTQIKYQIVETSKVELIIFNIRGQVVKTLIDEEQQQGHYNINWDGKNEYGTSVITGPYFIRLIIKQKKNIDGMTIDNIAYRKVIKMILIR